MFRGESISFFLMEKSTDFHPGISPTAKEKPSREDFSLEIAGLEKAIAATKERIIKYGTDEHLEAHLKKLEENLRRASERIDEM